MNKTRLHSNHVALQAKMIEFFGWDMPIEYSGIVEEHLAVRKQAGLFDVSHMGEIRVAGPQALDFIQYMTPNNAARVHPGKAQYSALTTPEGTFIDDLLVYALDDSRYLLVVNAANVDKDYAWICDHVGGFDVKTENVSAEYTQMALQGPRALEILQPLTDGELSGMPSFGSARMRVAGEESLVSRTGYTGEDGFEVYTKSSNPGGIWEAILEEGRPFGIRPIGLGARDTLRLESCLMLYGNDIDHTTTVLEAGLRWVVKFKKGDFLGRDALLKQKKDGLTRKLVGFEITGRGIARSHYPVYAEGRKVSEVTSGTFSPFLKKSIGLAYLPVEYIEVNTEIEVGVRGKRIPARVVPTPFYKREQS